MKYLQVIISIILLQILICVLSGRLQDKLFQKKKIKIYGIDGECGGKNVPFKTYIQGATANSMIASCSNSMVVVSEDCDSDNYKARFCLGEKAAYMQQSFTQDCNFVVTRCKFRENLDSCEIVYSKYNMNFCQLLDVNSIGASPLAVPYEPPLKCPGKKGVYRAHNVSINLAPFVFFPLDDWYWKLSISVYSSDNTRLMGCGHVEVRQLVN